MGRIVVGWLVVILDFFGVILQKPIINEKVGRICRGEFRGKRRKQHVLDCSFAYFGIEFF